MLWNVCLVELWNVGVDVNSSASVDVHAGVHVGVGVDIAVRMGGVGQAPVRRMTVDQVSVPSKFNGFNRVCLSWLSSTPQLSSTIM